MGHSPFSRYVLVATRVFAPIALVLVLALAGPVACRSNRTAPPTPAQQQAPATPYMPPTASAPPTTTSPAPAPMMRTSPMVQAQIQRGASIFASVCARCHGAAGQGSRTAPALIGPGALPSNPRPGARLRTMAFHSAHDVGIFIKDNMPPGSHTPPEQTAPVLAYLLDANGIAVPQPINPTSAYAIPVNR
jgi:mono/diheme cytochrome c family protein